MSYISRHGQVTAEIPIDMLREFDKRVKKEKLTKNRVIKLMVAEYIKSRSLRKGIREEAQQELAS